MTAENNQDQPQKEDGITADPLRPPCPECGSRRVHVRATRRPVRYMVCEGCLAHFKLTISYSVHITSLARYLD